MTGYRVKAGFAQDLDGMGVADIEPQPISSGLQFGRQSYALNGDVVNEAPFIALLWDMPLTVSQIATIYALFGFTTSINSAEVSLRGPNALFANADYDGIAVRPVAGQDGQRRGHFIYGLTIPVKQLLVQA